MFRIAIFLLIACNLFGNQKMPEIAVVGAGLSGLTLAHRLHKKGLNVQVYEARARVGGRVFSVNVMGHIAELGAQNILDGGDAKATIALINELKLEVEEKKTILNFNYCVDGEIINVKKLIKKRGFTPEGLQEELQTLSKTAHNMQEIVQTLFPEQDLLYQICEAILSGYEGSPSDKLSTKYIGTLYHFLLGGLSATHQNLGNEETVYLDHLMVKGGNSLLAEKLADGLHKRIHLQHQLVDIAKRSDGSYSLTFNNGKVITADIVVLTIPCPVYRDLSISDEVISQKRQLDIASIQYGTNAKVLVPIAEVNAQQAGYTNGRVVLFMNRDDAVINVYYIGKHGKFTSMTMQESFKQDFPLINRIYRVTSVTPPVFAADAAFARYTGPVGHSWPNDPFAQGSYSCIGAGQEELFTSLDDVEGETVKTLFAPIDNTLFFAGEHTSILPTQEAPSKLLSNRASA